MSYTLLLADDSVTTQRVLELTFAEHGVRVVGVSDGELALERLRTEPVHIVLADIGLAKMSGYDLATRIKRDPSFAALPVLLLTGAFDTVDEERVRQSGAAGTLVKPLESGFVIRRVKDLLGISGSGLAGTPPRPVTSADVTPEEPVPIPPPRDPHIPVPQAAWDQVREETGLEPDTSAVEPARADDYFDRLDAAFDSLDKQLAGTTVKPATRPAPPAAVPPASTPAPPPVASSATNTAPAPAPAAQTDAELAESMGLGDNWFEKTIAAETAPPAAPVEKLAIASQPPLDVVPPPPVAAQPPPLIAQPPPVSAPPTPVIAPAVAEEPNVVAAPEPALPVPSAPPIAASAPVELPASESQPPPTRPAVEHREAVPMAPVPVERVTMVAESNHIADAFETLLAAEQGEIQLPDRPTIEISDEVIDRIAARVAERLAEGMFLDTVSRVASVVTEQLVKDEIARIRNAARERKQ